MASLRNLLNPEGDVRRRSVKLILNINPSNANASASTSETPLLSPSSDISGNTNVETSEEPLCTEHEIHPDCPDTLACLPDTDGRPQHTLPVILRCAILGSPKRRLTIREIYAAMEDKYSYYKTAGPTWKQSVRHHLSLNRLFERQPRPVTDPGFGSYWTVNLTAPPGTKRPRKRGRPKDLGDGLPLQAKKRGRPPKNPQPEPSRATSPGDDYEDANEDEGEEEGRTFCQTASADDGHVSEDDCESEEEMIHPLDRRSSLVGLSNYASSQPPQPFTLPPFHTLGEQSEHLIDRMQIELSGLRRQSAEAVSVSLRLSEQLAEAQAEASRTRFALRTTESLLDDEMQKRRAAERAADEEARRRKAAEDALEKFLNKELNPLRQSQGIGEGSGVPPSTFQTSSHINAGPGRFEVSADG